MAVIINDPYARGGGAVAGQQLGNVFKSGLELLAHHKMNQVAQNRTQQVLKSLNFSPQQAQLISMFPQELQYKILSQMAPEGMQQEQPMDALQSFQQQPQGQLGQQGSQLMEQFNQPYQPTNQMDLVQRALSGQQGPGLNANEAMYQQMQEMQQRPQGKQLAQARALKGMPQKERQPIIQSPAMKRLQQQEQLVADKETLPVYKDIVKSGKDAQENIMRLDRMQELVNKGNLPEGLFNSVLEGLSDRLGIDISGIQNADAQEFKKLSKDFVKNAKSFFGARLTDMDLKTFLQTVPTLSQSNDGRQRVINNLRNLEEAKVIRKQALDSILRANNGRRPRDIEQQIDDLSKPFLDELAKKFKSGTYGPSDRQDNRGFIEKTIDYLNPTGY